MDEPWYRTRQPQIVAAVVLVVLLFGAILLEGGQTSTILSTVGSAIGDTSGASGSGQDTTGGGEVADPAIRPPTLLIVRTGTLELEVGSLGSTVSAAANIVTAAGGYVSASDESAAGDDATATVGYRIPAAAWETTLEGIRRLGTAVRHQQVETEEVTGQVVDLGARIANLRATEAALQAIMARATKISDVLDVQKGLTETRGEIERLVADKSQLEGRAAFGTLTVTFALPTPAAVTTAARGWDPATDVDRATGKLIGIGQWTVSTGIVVGIVGLPLLIGGSLLLVLGWQFVRLARWLVGRRSAAGVLPG